MTESIRSLRFEHFRGLPDCRFDLKGKNLVILGTNGKGKSAVVDGIEFIFSGQISRFVGSGTGGIDHDDAIQHIKKLGVPKVTVCLNPSNGVISRSLDSKPPSITDRQTVKDYFEQHPGVNAFILRRSKILNFVCDQDADRYQKFVHLLGISHIDNLQRSFVDAERQAREGAQRAKTSFIEKIAVFKDPVAGFEPQKLAQVLVRISEAVESFELGKVEEWGGVGENLPLLKAKRPEANKDKIDALTRALVILETPLPAEIAVDIANANSLRVKLIDLGTSSTDAPRSNVIAAGEAYLSKHTDEESCPLCEKPFGQPLSEVLTRLKQRSEVLRELREADAGHKTAISNICRYADSVAAQLRKDLGHSVLLDPASVRTLRNTLASILRWSRLLKKTVSSGHALDLVAPPSLSTLALVREECAATLKEQRSALVPADSSKLEAAIALLERGLASHVDIANAENAISDADELARRAFVAKEAFSKARENAIQKVFEQIAATVLNFYRRLHEFDGEEERSECTALELKPTSRAATGGLRLAIQFLGLADSKDHVHFSAKVTWIRWVSVYSWRQFAFSTRRAPC